jgi:translocation and assembly module TamB
VLNIDVRALGSSRDPHMDGTVDVTNGAFLVTSSGARYKNVRTAVRLALDRLTVDSLHVEDSSGHPLDVHGSLGTHELRVGELTIDATSRAFEVLHNEFGRVELDMALSLRGQFESPRATGRITISGGELKVDEVLDRALFRPYATEETQITTPNAGAALKLWDRIGLDLELHVPQTFKLTGSNVQVSPGTPIGIGDINLRAGGDLYLYKDPGQPLSTTGSLDALAGTYRFQGRVFDIDQSNSSINFHGDLDPELYVTVTRIISAVETRVTISGELQKPELHLASNPPLESSDILSLIVFGASPTGLTNSQQTELAVRAATLTAGFLATPLITAIENQIGLDVFEIEPGGTFGTGPKVTLGEELAPGLVARFSREFGLDPYDEATVEYYLTRILRLRATFSDAQSLIDRSPFRRVERAGIDLLVFFSF